MALMDILAGAQSGALYANAGAAVGLSAGDAAKAMKALCPAIAVQLKAKSQEDAGTFDALLDLLEDDADGSLIDDTASLSGGEATADGNAILDHIYGSRQAAISEMRKLAPQLAELALVRIAPISATAVLGALAKNQAAMPLVGAVPAAASEGGGLLGTIVSELIKGVVQGAARSLAPRRRRRRSTTSYFGTKRKRKTTRKRSRTPTLEDVFGEILGTKRR